MDHECGFSGCWKKIPNYICGSMIHVAQPWEVDDRINRLLEWGSGTLKGAGDIIEFHVKFEYIHPFQDGNGRIGRIIMLKQCIENKVKLMMIHEQYADVYKIALYKAQTTGDMSDIISVIKMCERAFREERWGYE